MPSHNPRQEKIDARKSRDEGKQERYHIAKIIADLKETIAHEADADRDQNDRQERKKRKLDIATLCFVIFTFVAVAIQACILNSTDKSIHEQTIISNNALVAVQRAFVAARNIEVDTLGNAPILYSFNLVWENVGTTATSDLEIGGEVTIGGQRQERWTLNTKGAPLVLLPKATYPFFGTNRFDGASINNIFANPNAGGSFMYGFAKYRDVFGKPHITMACFRLIALRGIDYAKEGNAKGITGVQCSQYNCADQDCKARYSTVEALKGLLSFLD